MEKGTNEERDYEPVTRATRVPLSSNDYLLCICDGHCEDCTLLKFPFFLSSCCSRITACISSGEVLKTNVTLCPSVNANKLCTLRHLCPLADKPSNFKLTSGAWTSSEAFWEHSESSSDLNKVSFLESVNALVLNEGGEMPNEHNRELRIGRSVGWSYEPRPPCQIPKPEMEITFFYLIMSESVRCSERKRT